MAIEDERFKELLNGDPFKDDEEEAFFNRVREEITGGYFSKESQFINEIDTYLSNRVSNLDSIIETESIAAAAKFAVLSNPIYGNKALSAEEIQKLFSDLKNKEAIKTKREILTNIVQVKGVSYVGIEDDLALAKEEQLMLLTEKTLMTH
ncbi:MAG: hypothetical protein ACXACY_31290 [Candidatus Hodarchaeales archaeon]|jgi:hypothetical protein